jgi:hypothetical protein
MDANDFLSGGGGRSAKFDTVGSSITGTILPAPSGDAGEVRQQTEIGTGKPLTWDNGDPKNQLVIKLQTALREDADDDGVRMLYVKGSKDPASKSLTAALTGALQAAKSKLAVGGTLTVTYTGNGTPSTTGFTPPKQYAATYAPPSEAFLTSEQPEAPATAPAAPTTLPTAAPPVTDKAAAIGEAKALLAAGLDDATIHASTGVELNVIAALRNAAA